MNLNKKIGFLLDNGLNPDFISSLNENKINFLFETLSKKKEPKEVVQTTALTFDPKNPADAGELDKKLGTKQFKSAGVDPTTGKVTLNTDTGENKDDVIKDSEIKEKFESKAQQGLFWARCNKCKSEDCKWCKMANEFDEKTSKKDYKNMPEKKHPEKTVKYKKKETKEGYLENVGKKVTDIYAKKAFNDFKPGLAWGGLKEDYNKIIEKYTQPTMKKRDLLKLIESEINRKKGLNEDFYMGMDEEFDFMSDTETDMPTRPKHRPDRTEDLPIGPDRTEGEPNWDEDEDDDIPRPRGKMGKLRMSGIDAPTIEPGIREPKIKPKEPDTTPKWTPDVKEPLVPDEDTESEPQAKRKKDFLNRFKHDFDRKMSRMDESTYKPINYRKF